MFDISKKLCDLLVLPNEQAVYHWRRSESLLFSCLPKQTFFLFLLLFTNWAVALAFVSLFLCHKNQSMTNWGPKERGRRKRQLNGSRCEFLYSCLYLCLAKQIVPTVCDHLQFKPCTSVLGSFSFAQLHVCSHKLFFVRCMLVNQKKEKKGDSIE